MISETIVAHDPASGLHYRLRPASEPTDPSFLLLHGLTGNEDVMWVIEGALPGRGLVAAARGLYPYGDGGYSWVEPSAVGRQSLAATQEAAHAVERWVQNLQESHDLAAGRVVPIGFSQGSGLAFALAERGRLQPAGVVALAGFLPSGTYRNLNGLSVFWGHGTRDEMVPVSQARQEVVRLRKLGAHVHFCQADVGHKVGVECMRGLEDWLAGCLPDGGR